MSGQIAKLISTIVGSDKLEACLKLSEINDINDVMNVDDKTLDNMEKFIRKKCANIPLNERKQFLDEELINNPEKFMIAPGLSQRILNTCNKVSSIFQNIPANETNVAAVSRNLLINSNKSNSTVNLKMLENVMKNDRFYHLNGQQLCITGSEPILSQSVQRFSLDSRPRNISMNFNNLVSIEPSHLMNNEQDDKFSKECNLNPPDIETNAIETEVVKKSVARKTVGRPKKVILPVESFTMEVESSPAISSLEPLSVTVEIPTTVKTEPITTMIPSPIDSVIITRVKSEPESIEKTTQPIILPSSKVSSSRYRTPTKSRVNPIEYYYAKIVDDCNRTFANCNLIPKIDFDVLLNIESKNDMKPCAHFVCYTCKVSGKSKVEKRLKFYLTSKGAIINSNILNHLKIHFKLKGDV